ncbi:MAG TPA: GNAT family N-acetyltransferase [Pyrinomonadaceae bacterium]|nr:GNAT family N-acetyltransferase [Pyrinomonadaceae bacterium]
MPQFTESKKVAVERHARAAGQALLVHPLTERHDETEVLDFLAERPVHNVVMSGLIRDNGLESPFNRGTFYACRDSSGALSGVALVGHATFVEARTEGALREFAALAQKERDAHMILGEQGLIRRFWGHYAGAGQTPRLFCRELLFEQRWPVEACEPVPDLRRATLDDLMLVMPVHAAMAYEESGVNPLDVDLAGFRLRCARRIEHGRVWVLVEDGNLVFKADVASETPECTYVEGVYVEPASRKRGHGLRCLSHLGRNLLAGSESVCALVNEQNLVAQSLFLRAGYKLRGYYETVFLERDKAVSC